jgi:hypothetical protein
LSGGVKLEDHRNLSGGLEPVKRAKFKGRLNAGGTVKFPVVGDFAEIVVEVGGVLVGHRKTAVDERSSPNVRPSASCGKSRTKATPTARS